MRHDRSSALIAAQEKTQSDVKGDVNPSQGFHKEFSSHGTRSVRCGRLLLDAQIQETKMLCRAKPIDESLWHGFRRLSTAAHVQSCAHWFRLLTRWRKEALLLLTKSRSPKWRHQNQVQKEKKLSRWPQCDIQAHLLISAGHASGDRLNFPGDTGQPEVTEAEAWKWNDNHWMSREQSASSLAGRNESQNLSARASGNLLQSPLKEDDDMMNLFKLIPNLVTRVEENLKKTCGQLVLTNFPINFNVNTASEVVRTVPSQRPRFF